MVKKLSADAVRRHRSKRLFLDETCTDIVKLADNNGGLHATSFQTPYFSLIARGITSPFQKLNQIQLKERKIVRLRAMRGMLFLLPAKRLPSLLSVFRPKPRIIKNYYQYWKVDPEKIVRPKKRVMDALSENPRTQKDLRSLLGDIAAHRLLGKRSDRATLLSFLLYVLQLEGHVISEKIVSQNTVRNVSRFVQIKAIYPDLPKSPPDEQCMNDVIRWYIDKQGPADLGDLAWWTGISKIQLKKIFPIDNLVEVSVGSNDRQMFVTPTLYEKIGDAPEPKQENKISLLPYEDPYLNGHKSRALLLHGVPEATVFSRGEARPTICVDGRVVGLWRFVEHGEELRIGVELFDKDLVDLDQLNKEKEKIIAFAETHFKKNLDKYAKGIFTGTEPYA